MGKVRRSGGSRGRRLLAGLAALIVVPLGLTAPNAGAQVPPPAGDQVRAAHGNHEWTTESRMVPVRTGPHRNIPIELDTTLYVPDSATAQHPQPAIVVNHGFGNDKDATEVVDTARFFAAHGYVVLTYTSSGFGDSGGCITLQSADYDVRSVSQLIDAVLEPRNDVRHDKRGVVVGTIGGSYGGGIQLPLAAADRRIRTGVVGRTWNDLVYSLDPNNRVVPGRAPLAHRYEQGVFKQEWTTLFFASGTSQPAMGNGGCLQAKTAAGDPAEIAGAAGCAAYYLPVCQLYARLLATGDADDAGRELIGRAAASTFLDDVHIPVLLTQGQSDTLFNLNDAVATYLGLRKRDVPVRMIWNSGGHGGYSSQPGECEVYDGVERSVKELDHCYLTLRSLRWMDHWLRGRSGGLGPGFSYYRDWVHYAGKGADDEQYGAASRFSLGGGTTFTLSGSDRLVRHSPSTGSATFLNPAGGQPAAYTETSNFTGPDSSPGLGGVPPQEVPGQFAAFTSAPFRHGRVSVGVPSATVRIGHANGQDLVFFAKVYDVAPDGSATLIHRLIAPVRVPAAEVDRPVRFTMPGFAHRFGKGHRVRLVLCSTDQTSYNSKVADVLTVTTGAGSTFTLPGDPS